MHVVRCTARSRQFSFRAKAKSPVTAANVTVELLPRTQTEGQDWHLRPTIYYKTLDVKCVLSSDEVQVKLKYITHFCVLNSRLSEFAVVTHILVHSKMKRTVSASRREWLAIWIPGIGCTAAAFEVYIIQMIEEARKAGNVAEAFSSLRDFTWEHRVQLRWESLSWASD